MHLPDGIKLIKGYRPGPTVAIVAGTHGNEITPVQALLAWQRRLQPERVYGRVFFVLGNPRALKRRVRFIEGDLNRAFGRTGRRTFIEARRARELKPIFRVCDAVLDLHASNTRRTRHFLIAEPAALRIGRSLPFPIVVHGFDRFEPGSIDWFANSVGGIGLCAECGYLDADRTRLIAHRAIETFLVATGAILGNVREFRQERLRVHHLYHNRSARFQPKRTWADLAPVRRHELIGLDGTRPIRASVSGKLLFVRERTTPAQECFLLLRS